MVLRWRTLVHRIDRPGKLRVPRLAPRLEAAALGVGLRMDGSAHPAGRTSQPAAPNLAWHPARARHRVVNERNRHWRRAATAADQASDSLPYRQAFWVKDEATKVHVHARSTG